MHHFFNSLPPKPPVPLPMLEHWANSALLIAVALAAAYGAFRLFEKIVDWAFNYQDDEL